MLQSLLYFTPYASCQQLVGKDEEHLNPNSLCAVPRSTQPEWKFQVFDCVFVVVS